MTSTSSRAFAWTGAALFALSLGYFFYTYVVTFDSTSSGPGPPTWRAITWNTALFAIFALHHSVFARTPVRNRMAAHVPPRLERSIYVWVASLLLIAVCALWEPLPGIVWALAGPWRWIMRFPLLVGIWLTLRSAAIIDIWDLAGTRQLETPDAQLPTSKRGAGAETVGSTEDRWELEVGSREFKTKGPYALVRHPIYLGWVLFVFSAPTMTMTRLLFAVVSCVYLIVAIPLEERTIIGASGDSYRQYMRQVRWRLIPGVW